MSASNSMSSIWQSSGLSSTAKSKVWVNNFSLVLFCLESGNLLANSLRSFYTLAPYLVQSRSGNSSFLVARHMKWVNVALLNWTRKGSNFFSKAQICSNSLFTSWLFPCNLKFRSDRCCVMSVGNAKSFNQFSSLKKAKFWCLLSIKNLISCCRFQNLSKVSALLTQCTAGYSLSSSSRKKLSIGDDLILELECNLSAWQHFSRLLQNP